MNNDGHTDLLVNGYIGTYTPIAVLDNSNDTFKLIFLGYSFGPSCKIVKSIKKNDQTLILLPTNKLFLDAKNNYIEYTTVDTLIYRFDTFIELNTKVVDYKIESIKFETHCYGTCPIFSIELDKTGKAIYNAGDNDIKPDVFKTTIKSKDSKEIYSLLNYINIKKLRDYYTWGVINLPTCITTIKFTDGSTKKITDQGQEGTYGLTKLYALFFALRENQNWQKVN
ncbi:MAG: DUF6438 domain-containing protein [Mucilaginibacter sp.]